MSFFDELEQAHASLKHFGFDLVDVTDLRSILRRAQTLATLFETHDAISFQRVEGGWEILLDVTVDSDTKDSLMYMLGE